ncbi:SRPBCC domain-containing protein [Shinella sp.]|uniref:SRPBCC family protein n=1 Tax=Shinella sp. TaxID=1870904 RepID=UPI00258B4750|nr:SRPBCC domain-containing protein [Shinella sp.]MCW5709654.1 SRPBCC domain-containing protein [Shinella sp.]
MTEALSVVMERHIPHPPEKIWRALTQPHLIAEWLMETDFAASVGHRFDCRAEWGSVNCEVLEVEPHRSLSYTWGDSRLKSIVTWTLTPVGAGTTLRMEQTGFKPDQPRYFQGAQAGWPRFLDNLDRVLDNLD